MLSKLRLFCGNSNRALALKICEYLDIQLGKCEVKYFSDGEIGVEIGESVRGMDVFVVQSTCYPSNENLMELLIMIDALKRASASRIIAVLPYYGYARQDRKVAPRSPITAKLVADLIYTAGATRVLSMDLHAGQIQGFFNIPFDHLYATPVLLDDLSERDFGENATIVSPDAGGAERARAFAKRIKADLCIIDKRRTGPNVAQIMNIIGDVEGKICIMLDDIVDTAGTLTQGAKALVDNGAKSVYAYCTHGVLSGPAIDRVNASVLEKLIVTDTIPLSENAEKCDKIAQLSVSKLLGEAIKRIYGDDSVSSLFV
ncbi:ribose-phosphate pyrophosphokinase [Thermodesulfobacteriota bacterium]